MFDNHIYLYLRGTSIQIEIKHDASTNELYNNIIGLFDHKLLNY
jgi:hypothetical protein